MTTGYFGGSAPDVGAYEYSVPTETKIEGVSITGVPFDL
jgi:hypothetical protein